MYKNILFPVDIMDNDSWKVGVPVINKFVESFGSKLHLVTVVPDFGASIVAQYFSKTAEQKIMADAKASLQKFAEKHLVKPEAAKVYVKQGGIYERIIEVAKAAKADLIVMTAHRPELKDYLLGPNAAKVVRHSNISVLVLREK